MPRQSQSHNTSTVHRSKRFAAIGAAALVLAGSLAGCSTGSSKAETEACEVIIGQAKSAGYTLQELAPQKISDITDGTTLSQAYSTVGSKLEGAANDVADVTVREIVSTAATNMLKLVPVIEAAATGDPAQIGQALAPVKDLGSLATTCAAVAAA